MPLTERVKVSKTDHARAFHRLQVSCLPCAPNKLYTKTDMTTTATRQKTGAPDMKTPWQRAKENRDRLMSEEYDALLAECPTRSKVEVNKYLMAKNGLSSVSAYYAALERGRRLREGGGS